MKKYLFNVWIIDYNPNKFNWAIPVLNTEMSIIAPSVEEGKMLLKSSVEIKHPSRMKLIDCCNLMEEWAI